MNLRQQFFWKVLIGSSTLIILFSIFSSYTRYSELTQYQLEYQKEAEVKDNKNMEKKTNFISNNQSRRIDFEPDLVGVIEKIITGHTRAGIKTDSKSDWESNDPIYRGITNNRVMIDYRKSKGDFYKKGDRIKDTEMIIESFSRDSVIIKYPTGIRIFYVESYQELKK